MWKRLCFYELRASKASIVDGLRHCTKAYLSEEDGVEELVDSITSIGRTGVRIKAGNCIIAVVERVQETEDS